MRRATHTGRWWGPVVVSVLLAACGDDFVAVTEGATESGTGTGTDAGTDTTPTTDPPTTGVTTDVPTSTEGPTTEPPTTTESPTTDTAQNLLWPGSVLWNTSHSVSIPATLCAP